MTALPSPLHDTPDSRRTGLGRAPALALAASAYLVPYVLSRSTSPTPDHPRVLLWYRLLRKPSFQPPDLAFPLAWVAIETGLAWAGYRLLRRRRSPRRDRALALLAGNVLGIGGWSRLFFGERNLPVATVASAALGIAAATSIVQTRKVDPTAAAASVPLVLWVGFATVLTAAIWRKNR